MSVDISAVLFFVLKSGGRMISIKEKKEKTE